MATQVTQPSRAITDTLSAGAIGIVIGLLVHGIAVYARDHGPTFGGFSIRGNGAIAILLLAPVAVVIGEVIYARRRSWLGMAVLPLATFLGLFVILGGV